MPLGADEEAAGAPPDPWAVETARAIELSRPCKSIAYRGVGAAWLLMTFAAALGAGIGQLDTPARRSVARGLMATAR
jgi:hypothetical protein